MPEYELVSTVKMFFRHGCLTLSEIQKELSDYEQDTVRAAYDIALEETIFYTPSGTGD